MSLNVSGSKYVKVFDPEIKLKYSDKVVFANLSSSRKTGNDKKDKKTGETLKDPKTGTNIVERIYSRWDARFVGNAFEAAKGLRGGENINIINGWIVNEPFTDNAGKKHFTSYITITEFELSDVADGEDEEEL